MSSRFIATVAALSLAGLVGAAPADAQSLPACSPERNGRLIQQGVSDPSLRPGSPILYATHRLDFRLAATDDDHEEADGARYSPEADSLRLAPGPGVVAPFAFIRDAPGPVSVFAQWVVVRSAFGEQPTRACMGSQRIPLTLRAPTRTTFQAKRLLTEASGQNPRFLVNIAGGKSENHNPITVRIRRGSRGKRRTLFTLPLADAAAARGGNTDVKGLRRFSFKKRFAGMVISTDPSDAAVQRRGLVTLGVKVPRVRAKRRMRRSFTLEFARGSRTLFRLRAVIRCRGLGRAPALQICTAPVYRVKR